MNYICPTYTLSLKTMVISISNKIVYRSNSEQDFFIRPNKKFILNGPTKSRENTFSLFLAQLGFEHTTFKSRQMIENKHFRPNGYSEDSD